MAGLRRRGHGQSQQFPVDPSGVYVASEYNLLTLWVPSVSAYRAIPLDGVVAIRTNGKTYRVVS